MLWEDNLKKSEIYLSLNNKQQDAICLPNNHALILAGAGTGKTKTLIARIQTLLEYLNIPSKEILAVTFTTKAAEEMTFRLRDSIGKKAKGIMVGTFHKIAFKWLKEDPVGFGYKDNPVVIDTDDQKSLVKRLYKEKKWNDATVKVSTFISFVNSKKEKGIRAKDVNLNEYENKLLKSMYESYEKKLKQENALDFAELLMAIRDRLKFDNEYRQEMSSRFSTILVDEFQDTNPLQYELLSYLIGSKTAIFAVGDDDQSIYGFRGARVQNIFDFATHYAKKNVIKLEQNYRSTGNILGAANEVINKGMNRTGKSLWTLQEPGSLIFMHKAKDADKEAEMVVKQIKSALLITEVKPKDIAVLYRTNFQSRAIEQFLIKSRIPYKVVGGMQFFDRAEIKILMAHARMLVSLNDVGAVTKAIKKPAQGIGNKKLEEWLTYSFEHDMGLEDVIKLMAYPKESHIKSDDSALNFIKKIEFGRMELAKYGISIGFKSWIEKNDICGLFKKEENYEDRAKNIEEFVSMIKELEDKGCRYLNEFVTNIALDNIDLGPDGGVQLSTIHASKGLEYDYVHWVGLEEGITPSAMALKEHGEDEERRLAYVAITRAKKELNMYFCEKRLINGEIYEQTPSRFVGEISPELLYPMQSMWPPKPEPYMWGEHMGKMSGRFFLKEGKNIISSSSATRNNVPEEVKVELPKIDSRYIVEFKKGMKVKHPRFGIGTVRRVFKDNAGLENVSVYFLSLEKDMTLIGRHSQLMEK